VSDKVYYDESCYVCSLEINTLRKRGEACGIEFVDISSPEFEETGDYDSEMIGEFGGQKTVGVETFRVMYEKMGFTRLVSFSRLPVIRNVVNVGYKVFAYGIRPYLPKKKV
jgi:predicted DCC family thiol-disulfide oxidoreductase YuxK